MYRFCNRFTFHAQSLSRNGWVRSSINLYSFLISSAHAFIVLKVCFLVVKLSRTFAREFEDIQPLFFLAALFFYGRMRRYAYFLRGWAVFSSQMLNLASNKSWQMELRYASFGIHPKLRDLRFGFVDCIMNDPAISFLIEGLQCGVSWRQYSIQLGKYRTIGLGYVFLFVFFSVEI